jgi:NAD(P)-dependent dehydrogenase (short-subunit alcohol dehydrogenase family)
MTDSPLRGRVAVVTGAARGIGAELAGQLADRGARMALLGLEPRQLAAVASRCGPGTEWWEVDVTDPGMLERAAADVADRIGPADVVVANAGIGIAGSLLLADPASFDRVIEVNLLGSVRTARAFLPQLVRQRGYLLQIASVGALAPMPLSAAYGASKAGVESFVHALRVELAPHGVGAGVAYLSWTDTDLVRGVDAVPGMASMRARLPFPFNRTYPVPAAVARLVAGIERRAAHVYAPAWVAAVLPVRGVLPALAARATGRHVAAGEAALRAAGPAGSLPVGPGGLADRQFRATAGSRESAPHAPPPEPAP